MDLNCFTFNQYWLKGLDTKPVKRRRTIQQNGVLPDNLFQDVVHDRVMLLDQLLGRLDCGNHSPFLELLIYNRLEEL